MPEMPLDDINRVTKETMETFTPIYVKSYAIGLIEKLKEEADPATPVPWQLKTPPIPAEPLKEGWLEKQGAVKVNWKKRYFVATNQADNFRVYYFEKEEQKTDPTKKKGEIQLCGYKIKNLDKEEEKKEFGSDFAFTCKPYGRRRQWFLRCADADERRDWAGIFKYAASNAHAPLNPDQVMQFAFKEAYRATRWRLGVWGWYSFDRTEEEQLSQMIVDKLEDEVMGPVYAKIPGGRLERKIRKQMQDVLDSTVGSVVASLWKVCVSTIDAGKGEVEANARKCLGEVFEKQAEFKKKIGDGILSIIQPPLNELTKPVMTPICNCLMGPLTAAYASLMKAFHSEISKIIEDGVKEADLKDLVRRVRYWWGMPMYPALYNIYKAFRDGYSGDEPETAKVSLKIKVNIGDIIDALHGVSAWQIEDEFEKSLRTMMGKAIFTFASELETDTGAGAPAVLKATMKKFMADSKLQITKDIQNIFKLVLQPPFKKKVDPLIEGVLSPISDAIPDALKTFLDVEGMAIDIMDEVLSSVIDGAVEAGSGEALSMLDSLPGELGF